MRATIHTIEAVVGTLILLLGVTTIHPIDGQSSLQFSDDAYSCLSYLDESGYLRLYAYNNMTADLNASIGQCLPKVLSYDFAVCDSEPCSKSLPSEKSVFLSSYMLSGKDSYEPLTIKLWVWLK